MQNLPPKNCTQQIVHWLNETRISTLLVATDGTESDMKELEASLTGEVALGSSSIAMAFFTSFESNVVSSSSKLVLFAFAIIFYPQKWQAKKAWTSKFISASCFFTRTPACRS